MLTVKFHAIGDSRPPNALLKQEGLQLATRFRDMNEAATNLQLLMVQKRFQIGEANWDEPIATFSAHGFTPSDRR